MVSDRADDDERAAEAWAALERALAGIILLGPCGASQAHAVGGLASEARADDVANWLAALYPPPGEGFSLGAVQPDRLAELLLGPILTRQTDLLGKISVLVDAVDGAYAVLFTLLRTAVQANFGQVGDQAADLVATQPDPFAVAAPVLAATFPQPGPLRDGLLRLGRRDPEGFERTAFRTLDQLPEISVSGALFSAALTTVMTEILRPLAETNRGVYLPHLAGHLSNLGNRLAAAGQRQAALAPAQEAVEIYRQLAQANPDTNLPSSALSLNNLGNRMADTEREDEIRRTWESTITGPAEESWRLSLTVAYARYLLGRPSTHAGVDLLVTILAGPTVPGSVEADARRLLRGHWRQHPPAVEQVWRSVSTDPLPGWILVTDDHVNTVIGWLNTGTWAESRHYFGEHSGLLLADTTPAVLSELALTAPEDLISFHRSLLEAIREHGLDAAYWPLLSYEVLREWIAAPDWEASRAFLHYHPQLLGEDIPGLLADLTDDPDAAITVHQALLTLTRTWTPAGIDRAYQSLEDGQLLQDTISAAIAARDAGVLQACAEIETLIHGRAFAGALHMIVAWLLTGPARQLPEDWASELPALAAQANPAEKDTALAQFSTTLDSIPADEAIVGQLRTILSLPPKP